MRKHCLLSFPNLVALLPASFPLLPKLGYPASLSQSLRAACQGRGPYGTSARVCVRLTLPTVLLCHSPTRKLLCCSGRSPFLRSGSAFSQSPWSPCAPGSHILSLKKMLCETSSRASHSTETQTCVVRFGLKEGKGKDHLHRERHPVPQTCPPV